MGFFVKVVDRELMHPSHLFISKSPQSRLIQNFKAMFSEMFIESKDFVYPASAFLCFKGF